MPEKKTEPAPPASPLSDQTLLDQLGKEAAQVEVAAAPPAPEPEVTTAQILEMVIGPTAAILAPNWAISAQEVTQLSKLYGALIDKYVPDMQTSYGLEISAVLVTVTVLMPRIGKPRKLEEKPKKGEGATADAGA